MKHLIFLSLLTGIFTTVSAYTKGKTYKITILHTNDHHGRFWQNKDGELGLAPRLTLINEIKAEVESSGGKVLLLDAGDVNTGVPQSDMLDAEPDFKGMKLLNYDVMAVGNHEFDNSLSVIRKQQEWAGFPFISANIYDEKTKKRLFKPSIFKNVDDLKIAILGLTTKDTPFKTNPHNVKGIVFKDPIEEAKKLVPCLKKRSDVLIALTHMGHYPNESHGSDAPGDVTLARQVNGIDVIIGGHSHVPLFEPDYQNNTYIVQAFEWGKYLGRVDLEFTDGKLSLKNYKLIPVNLKKKETVNGQTVMTYLDKEIKADPLLVSFLEPFKLRGDQSLQIVFGEAEGLFEGSRAVIRNTETNLGNLLTKAYKEKFNADLSISNSGGIRDSVPAGKISYETILTVLPFGGEIVTVELSGEKLKTYLTDVALKLSPGTGSFPQMSGVFIKGSRAGMIIYQLLVNGKEIMADQIYKIALPEFIAQGGDGYPSLKHEPTFRKYGFVDAEIFKEYVDLKKVLRLEDYKITNYLQL
jgi:5'-nucleotidase/UDP-sugar diphosphatase